jgi:outer membrane biogenesis lipoprotein LolB
MNKQVQLTVSGLCILLLSGCAQLTVRDQMNDLNSRTVDTEYQFEELPTGMQADPDLDEQVIVSSY